MRIIPAVTKNLLIINVLLFLASWLFQSRGLDLNAWGGLHFFFARDFHLYQLLTYLFLHASFQHVFFNMFALWMFGSVIERCWGPRKFLFFYLSCGIGAGLIQELAQLGSFLLIISPESASLGLMDIVRIGHAYSAELNSWTTIGASGAVYGVLLAFGMLFPEERMFIFPIPIPIKAKWFITFYVALELIMALASPGDGVAHTAHLGGMLFAFLMIRYWRRHPADTFGSNAGRQFFDSMRRNFERHSGRRDNPHMHVEQGGAKESDWEYNARKKANQEEVDRILDKIRRSGYDSLTKEEKKTLFDSSNND